MRPEQHIKVNINKEYIEKIKKLKKEGLKVIEIRRLLNIDAKLIKEVLKNE